MRDAYITYNSPSVGTPHHRVYLTTGVPDHLVDGPSSILWTHHNAPDGQLHIHTLC